MMGEFSERSLCSHIVQHVHITYVFYVYLFVGAMEVLGAHLFSWNILRNGSPVASCW